MTAIVLAENSTSIGKRIVELAVPATTNILAIKRRDVYISPNGSTMLQVNDILYVLAEDADSLALLEQSLGI